MYAKSKTGKLIGALLAALGGTTGMLVGGNVAVNNHNETSKSQFLRALRGSMSGDDHRSLPFAMRELLDKNEGYDEIMKHLPQVAPEIANRDYTRRLFETQTPR